MWKYGNFYAKSLQLKTPSSIMIRQDKLMKQGYFAIAEFGTEPLKIWQFQNLKSNFKVNFSPIFLKVIIPELREQLSIICVLIQTSLKKISSLKVGPIFEASIASFVTLYQNVQKGCLLGFQVF